MPQHPLAEKIDVYLRRLQSSTTAVFAHAQSLKRAADAMDVDSVKRQKLEPVRRFPPLPPPPNTVAQLFTLIENPEFQQFDVKILPEEVVCLISSALMQHIDSKSLDEAVEEVQMRLQKLQDAAKAPSGADDDDDYDPEAIAASVDGLGTQNGGELLPQPTLELGPFELPKPLPLSEAELAMLSEQTIAHVFETALSSASNTGFIQQNLGLNRLAGSTNDRESWLTVMIRLATRAPAGLDSLVDNHEEVDGDSVKSEYQAVTPRGMDVPNRIRQLLFDYIIDDWKHRLSLGITWLTEEWYADKVQNIGQENNGVSAPGVKADTQTPNYEYWTTRLFETLIPRFDKDDHRFLIRFLAELPSLNSRILSIVKPLTHDPATVEICKKALQYLYLMRPPVRTQVVDVMEQVWREGDVNVKNTMGQLLSKWRPGVVEEPVSKMVEGMKGEETRTFQNGVKSEFVKVGDGAAGKAEMAAMRAG